MDHSHHSGTHSHPQTFTDVIERGFPLDTLDQLDQVDDTSQDPQVHDHDARAAARSAIPLKKASETAQRRDQAELPDTERKAFRDAVAELVQEGKYLEIVRQHMEMSHMMHGSMGPLGLYRFLAWHRRYLLEMERELQRVDAILRPAASVKIGIPYWKWQDPFPVWMDGFLPQQIPGTSAFPPPRKNNLPPEKANAADVNFIVHGFASQQTPIPGENDYTKFTWGVEGWGRRPDGSALPAHNHGHSWIGGIMNNTSTSPTDPIFWLHHAEVDRLWESWRQANPAPGPPLTGASRIMDPWAESYDDLLDTAMLGYTYDSLAV